MSSSRGNTTRKRPQKHQNKSAFKNDLYDTSNKIRNLNSLEISGVCKRCKDKIEWKIKYKKYKPLTVPKKCVSCNQKVIKYAYHIMCDKCSSEKNICTKCCKPVENEEPIQINQSLDLQSMLKGISERKRRTALRQIGKLKSGQQNISPETIVEVDNIISTMKNVDLNNDLNDFLSDDFSSSDSDIENEIVSK